MIRRQSPSEAVRLREIRSELRNRRGTSAYRIWGITFGEGIYRNSRTRFANQMRANPLFSHVIEYGKEDLDPAFQETHAAILSQPRGFGYWIWKPQVIWKTLQQMKEGEVLLQGDAGCTISTQFEATFHDFQQIWVERSGCMASPTWNTIGTQTKRDTQDAMGIPMESVRSELMVAAGLLLFRKCPTSMKLVEEWLQYATMDSSHLLDDSPSIQPNLPEFREHRHDQSIFNLLFYKYGGYTHKYSTFRATRIKDVSLTGGSIPQKS